MLLISRVMTAMPIYKVAEKRSISCRIVVAKGVILLLFMTLQRRERERES